MTLTAPRLRVARGRCLSTRYRPIRIRARSSGRKAERRIAFDELPVQLHLRRIIVAANPAQRMGRRAPACGPGAGWRDHARDRQLHPLSYGLGRPDMGAIARRSPRSTRISSTARGDGRMPVSEAGISMPPEVYSREDPFLPVLAVIWGDYCPAALEGETAFPAARSSSARRQLRAYAPHSAACTLIPKSGR